MTDDDAELANLDDDADLLALSLIRQAVPHKLEMASNDGVSDATMEQFTEESGRAVMEYLFKYADEKAVIEDRGMWVAVMTLISHLAGRASVGFIVACRDEETDELPTKEVVSELIDLAEMSSIGM